MMRQRFDTLHEQNSGHKAETEPVELVSLRLISLGLVPQAKLSPGKVTGRKSRRPKPANAKFSSAKSMARLKTQIYNRDLFEPGHKITGPAIVEQLDTTTVIHPRARSHSGRISEYHH